MMARLLVGAVPGLAKTSLQKNPVEFFFNFNYNHFVYNFDKIHLRHEPLINLTKTFVFLMFNRILV